MYAGKGRKEKTEVTHGRDGDRRNTKSAINIQQQCLMLGQEIRQLEKSCNLKRKHFQEMAKLKQKEICKRDE